MRERARPPDDISPVEFFTRWLPDTVDADPERRQRLGGTHAVIVFELSGDDGGIFSVHVTDGRVKGAQGESVDPDLHVRLDVATWRELNRGDLSAPEAAVRRRVKLSGNLLLAIKLHLIIG